MKVLLAVDNTQQAEEAAHSLSDSFPGADIEILHVLDIEAVPHSHLSAAMIDQYHEKIRRGLRAEANRFLPRVLGFFLHMTGRARVSVREGRAVDVILETASSSRSDLIVLGSRGLSPLRAWLLGGVSYRVAQEASCPVLLCKHVLPARPNLLVVLDQSHAAEQTVRFLSVQSIFPAGRAIVLMIASASSEAAGHLEQVRARLSDRGFTVESGQVAQGRVSDILARAREHAADVIVVGTDDRHGWLRRWLQGSLSHEIIRQASTSVLIVHGREGPKEEENE